MNHAKYYMSVLVGTVLSAHAATYYVAPDGSDNALGLDKEHPLASIQKAFNLARNPGDSVILRGGTYSPSKELILDFSGSAASPIVIKAYPEETPIIDGQYKYPSVNSTWVYTGPPRTNDGVLYSTGTALPVYKGPYLYIRADHIVIEGLSIVHSTGCAISSNKHGNFTVRNCDIHENHTGGIFFGSCHDIVVEDTKVWENANIARFNRDGDHLNWPSTVNFCDSHDVLFQRNLVYHNWGEGVGCYRHPHHIVFQDNVIYENYAKELYLNNASHILVQRNLVYNTGNPVYFFGRGPCYGIDMANERGPAPKPGDSDDGVGHDRTIINNLVMGCGIGICFQRFNGTPNAAGTRMENDLIAYNTIVCAPGMPAIRIDRSDEGTAHKNVAINNNLFIGNLPKEGKLANVAKSPGITFSHNVWSASTNTWHSDESDITGKFKLAQTGPTGPGKLTPEYFKVVPESSFIGKAEATAAVREDFLKGTRPAHPTAGAIEP